MQVHWAPFVQHLELQPLGRSNAGSLRFTDLPSLCACSQSSMANLIGWECSKNWTRPVVVVLSAGQKECCLWGRACLWVVLCQISLLKLVEIVLKSFIKMSNILQLKQPNNNKKQNHFFTLRKSTKYLRDKIHSWYCVTFMWHVI